MNTLRYVFTAVILSGAAPVLAQSCANPIPITIVSTYSGNTCTSTPQLPSLANGAIQLFGNQDIYHVGAADVQVGTQLVVTPSATFDVEVFVCRNQCSTYATCVSAEDAQGPGGVETAKLPPGPGDYYVIIGSPPTSDCGTYTMSVLGPL